MVSNRLENAARYRSRADEVRRIAANMRDKTAKATLKRVAEDYEMMANQLEEIERDWDALKPR